MYWFWDRIKRSCNYYVFLYISFEKIQTGFFFIHFINLYYSLSQVTCKIRYPPYPYAKDFFYVKNHHDVFEWN